MKIFLPIALILGLALLFAGCGRGNYGGHNGGHMLNQTTTMNYGDTPPSSDRLIPYTEIVADKFI